MINTTVLKETNCILAIFYVQTIVFKLTNKSYIVKEILLEKLTGKNNITIQGGKKRKLLTKIFFNFLQVCFPTHFVSSDFRFVS